MAPAFDLDRFGSALFDEAQRGANGIIAACLESAERQIGHQQRTLDSASHGPRRDEHFIECDWESIFVTEGGVREAVADEDHIYTGFVREAGGGVVISRQHDDLPAAL